MATISAGCARVLALAITLAAAAAMPAGAAQRVKTEPTSMRVGERVRVDNGACPPGQILEVVGAAAKSGTTQIERRRQCVSRKR
jgi:hypothetical protein